LEVEQRPTLDLDQWKPKVELRGAWNEYRHRNRVMADLGMRVHSRGYRTRAIAILAPQSPTKGAQWTEKYAKLVGLPVTELIASLEA
jgi:hypothetical protein